MKKCKILPLAMILLLAVTLLPVSALAVTEPDIGAQAAMIVDVESGEVYYQKNPDRIIQPASTTKMMTALLTVEAVERGEISLSDSVTASDYASYNLDIESTDSRPRIEAGETLTVQDLLYCAMLVSANEACNILAEYVSGSIDAFVSEMNGRANQLGCTSTHFSNANGLEDPDHYSTAADFALIAREAIHHPVFQQICSTLNYTVPATNYADARTLLNTNNLLDSSTEFYYEYAYGIKTGFFTNAGYCLVSAAQKDSINVICVVMGSPNFNDQFRDTLTLYNWLFDNFEYRQILSSAETVVTVPVKLGTSDSTGVRAEDAVSVILPKDYDTSRIGYQYVLYHEAEGKSLEAPVNAGQVLGEITVVELDENKNAIRTFGTSQLVAASSVEMSRLDYISSQIRDLFQEPVVRRIILILIVLLAVYLLLIIIYYIQRARHLSSLRRAKKDRARRQTAEEARWLSMPESRRYEEDPALPAEERKPVPAQKTAAPKASKPAKASKSAARKPAPAKERQDDLFPEDDLPSGEPSDEAISDDDFDRLVGRDSFADVLNRERYSGDDFGMEDFLRSKGKGSGDEEKKPADSFGPDILNEDDFFDSFFK